MKNEAPIIRLFFARMKPAFFQLSDKERRQFMARDRANLDALGMKAICMIDCTKSGSDWDYIGVESWPSAKALKERERFESDELHIAQYVEHKVELGVEQSFEKYGRP